MGLGVIKVCNSHYGHVGGGRSSFCFKKFLQFLKKNIIQFLIENKIL